MTTKSGWGEKAVLFVPHVGSRRSSFITRSLLGYDTVFVQREPGRCSVRAEMTVGKGLWRYLHKGCHCDQLCKESRVKHLLEDMCLQNKPKTWVFLYYPAEYTVHQWIQAGATQSYYHARRIIFSSEGIPCKRSAY